MKIILTLSLSILLAGCASAPLGRDNPGLYTVPVGSIIRLNQALTIPPQRVSTAIQYGEPTVAVVQEDPHCKFEVNSLLDKTVTLPAADYRITRVLRYSDPFYSHMKNRNVQVASSSNTASWLAMSGAPDSQWYLTTVFRLESDAYPDIRQLVCGIFYYSGYFARDMTIQEFNGLAGDMMTILPAAK